MILTSRNNPLIKEMAALKEKKGRKEQGFFLAEGVKMVSECKRSGLEIGRTFVSESYRGETDENAICVSDEVFAFLSDEKTPQGILCSVRIPKPSLCPPKESCLLLDGVSDPGNMGAIIRTANAAGYGEIYLVGCTDPYSPKSVRASMSGIFFVKIYTGTREAVLEALSDLPVLAADMDGENIFSFRPPEKFALAIGNEANGISEEVFQKAQHKLKIPMRAAQESLNAGIAAGIAMYLLKKDKFTDMERS